MNSFKCRFAPSPTGLLHAGNARVALINWLIATSNNGSMLLRLDNTDIQRSSKTYEAAIKRDLEWLNINWVREVQQINRINSYDNAVNTLKEQGRLYPCYESQEELEYKRRRQLKAGSPPIYDRQALGLSKQDRIDLEASGRKPYYRFKLNHSSIQWHDLIRGPSYFEGKQLSDPILIRGDGSYLYHLPSCVDDIELGISHVIRGEDHISNTAIHMQLFQALSDEAPRFAHLPLMTDLKGVGLSKRFGSTTIESLRQQGCEPETLASYLINLGSNRSIKPIASVTELAKDFDIARTSSAKPKFDLNQLWAANTRTIQAMPFEVASIRFKKMGLNKVTKQFWSSIRANIKTFDETKLWYGICFGNVEPIIDNVELIHKALDFLPDEPWDSNTWYTWIKTLERETDLKGKELFLPLRKAVTGKGQGPELKMLLPLIGRKKVMSRLKKT